MRRTQWQETTRGTNGYGKKTIISDYGECEIAVPWDRNGEFEPKVLAKLYAKGMSQRDTEDTIREDLWIGDILGDDLADHRLRYFQKSTNGKTDRCVLHRPSDPLFHPFCQLEGHQTGSG